MRLAAVEKMGYYPTPSSVTDIISKWLNAPDGEMWRLLDPCAGEGEAAFQLAQAVGGTCETWGVELSPARAEKAAQVLTKVYNTAWQSVRVTKGAVSVLWLNPPYDNDYDGDDKRVEIEFLRTSLTTLAYGGILIYIVPQRLLGYRAAARMLVGHFENLVVRRFPAGEYERFNQVVVFGTRKPYEPPTKEQVEAIRTLTDADIHPLGRPVAPWPLTIPPAPARKARFCRVDVSGREKIARAYALGWPDDLLDALHPKERAAFCPAMPLKKGHVAMLMASGLMGTMRLEKNGQPMLVKGRVVKHVSESTEETKKGTKVTIQRERFVTTVGVITPESVRIIDDVEGLTEFMEGHGDEIAAEILKNPPLYDLKPTSQEWKIVSSVGINRKPLPGRKQPGLLDVQKHAAIALARACREHGNALIQGEMGLGKTTIALATIDLLGAYPALIICPPHLVPKWMREAQEVISGVQVRELKRIGKNGGEGEVNDVRQFVQDWDSGLLGNKAIAVVASTSAKLGSGWDGAAARRYTLPRSKEDRASFREALERYREARNALRALKDLGSQGLRPVDEETLEEQRRITAKARRDALKAAVAVRVCPQCGAPLDRETLRSRKPVLCAGSVEVWDHQEAEMGARKCEGPLFEFGGQYKRWPMADYIRKKMRGFFRVLVADEVHQYKAKDSDQGWAFGLLAGAIPAVITLTGTFFGGPASSIFWLLHRTQADVREDYGFSEEARWVRRFGVLETTFKIEDDDYGVYSGKRRRRVSTKERPGISPGIVRYTLPTTIFASIKDLGVNLPEFHEEFVTFAPSQAMDEDLRSVWNFTWNQLKEYWPHYTSAWLQWNLARPNSCFRHEVIEGYNPIIFRDGRFKVTKAPYASFPVLRVTGLGASAYAHFYGRRLPMAVEWIYVAKKGRIARNNKPQTDSGSSSRMQMGWMMESGSEDRQRLAQKPVPREMKALQKLEPVLSSPPNAFGIRGMNEDIGEWALLQPEATSRAEPDDAEYVILGGIETATEKDGPLPSLVIRQPWESFEEVGFRCVRGVQIQSAEQE